MLDHSEGRNKIKEIAPKEKFKKGLLDHSEGRNRRRSINERAEASAQLDHSEGRNVNEYKRVGEEGEDPVRSFRG